MEPAVDAVGAETSASSASSPAKPKWVPPSVRRRMEEEAAKQASEHAGEESVQPSPERVASAGEQDTSDSSAPAPAPAAASPNQKWVPPSVRRKLEEEAAAAAQGAAGYPAEATRASSSGAERMPSKDDDNFGGVHHLQEWLEELGIADVLPAAERWCEDLGAMWLEEVVEEVADFVKALDLTPAEQERVTTGARRAWQKVDPAGRKRGASDGISLRTLSHAAASSGNKHASAPSLMSLDVEASQGTQSSDRSRRESLPLTLQASHFARTNWRKGIDKAIIQHRTDSPSSSPTAQEASRLGVKRASTIRMEGMFAPVMGSLPVSGFGGDIGKTLSVREVSRSDAHLLRSHTRAEKFADVIEQSKDIIEEESPISRQASNDDKPGDLPESAPRKKPSIKRVDTCGFDISASTGAPRRERLTQRVHQSDMHAVNINQSQTGTVYALESGNVTIAVFKPLSGEQFSRRGIDAGQGFKREEAAYLVDRLCGSAAKVPVTARAFFAPDGGEEVQGSVQEFVDEVVGFIDDFGVPRDLGKAHEFLCSEAAEAVALLDIRIFNMDRHGGNLLLTKNGLPHSLGPIDHGCSLPPWWCLSEPIFDAWLSWPFFKTEPSQYAKGIAKDAYDRLSATCSKCGTPEEDCEPDDAKSVVGLDSASILTLKICTLLEYVGVYELSVPIASLAAKMLRDEDNYEDLTWLEQKIYDAAEQAGAKCHIQEGSHGCKEIEVDDADGLQEKMFLEILEDTFRLELTKEFPPPVKPTKEVPSEVRKAPSRW